MSEELPADLGKNFPNSTNSDYAVGYKRPPLATRFQPGQSGNPIGRPPNAGHSLREHINTLSDQKLTHDELVCISKNKKSHALLVIAANRLLAGMERPDLSDYEPLLDGQMSIRELKASGVDTVSLKKVKQKNRSVPDGEGGFIHEIEREIELHDRSREESVFIPEQTDGKPTQPIDQTIMLPASVRIVTPLTDTEVIDDGGSPDNLGGGAEGDDRRQLPAADDAEST